MLSNHQKDFTQFVAKTIGNYFITWFAIMKGNGIQEFSTNIWCPTNELVFHFIHTLSIIKQNSYTVSLWNLMRKELLSSFDALPFISV